MKTLFNMFKSMGKPQKRLIKIIGIFFLICIIAVIVIGLLNNRKLSYSEIEKKLLSSAKSYYSDNEEMLPLNGSVVSIDSAKLIELKYMKEFTKYNKELDSCTGSVSVMNNEGNYLYIPSLKCGEYETTSLYNKILKEQQIVTSGDGLYALNGEYIYRGEELNNYVTFANQLWRIVKLTSDKEIRLIQVSASENSNWDDRYNVSSNDSSGITIFEKSRIKDELLQVYDEIFSNEDKSYIVSKKLCIGTRKENETVNDGSIECSKLTEDSYPVGMLQVNEYLLASIDSNCNVQTDYSCANYNYLAQLKNIFWSITTSNLNDYKAYYFVRGTVKSIEASRDVSYRLTLNIVGSVPFKSGDGTKDNPYIIY